VYFEGGVDEEGLLVGMGGQGFVGEVGTRGAVEADLEFGAFAGGAPV
jgi:hypothetical protein